jgi:hypothetical protein
VGLATSIGGGTWLAEDIPILFHTINYMVWGVLLEWWGRVLPKHIAATPHSTRKTVTLPNLAHAEQLK